MRYLWYYNVIISLISGVCFSALPLSSLENASPSSLSALNAVPVRLSTTDGGETIQIIAADVNGQIVGGKK